ncbi:MAG: radical SAM protein [Actinomycetota bacterium]|jgi:radical SAM superfamily enzyme YgiQ (UPF0313 family)|nr:B12-binding domain-containing radical SAM protein [Actinomycetota bacterium]MCL6094063.1 B12-binding domain-containing radical SAM protein [Actinomycetota bacterium]MDA8167855.1 radical SAM protein [Actinomycetota bacterium]
MPDLALIYLNDGPASYAQISIGIGSISAYLRSKGHQVFVFDTYYDSDASIIEKICCLQPKMIGISTTEIHSYHAFTLSETLKDSINVPIIFGGIFPSLFPRYCLNRIGVDLVCVGDGEFLLNQLLNETPYDQIHGLWTKEDNLGVDRQIAQVDCLDNLPWLDYTVFRYNSIISVNDFGDGYKRRLFISSSRGCNYSCSFCCNREIRKKLKQKMRYRRINDVIDEMLFLKHKFSFDEFFFTDENFIFNEHRAREFCAQYIERRVNKHFGFLARPDTVCGLSDALINDLKLAGCSRIHMGVETGDEEIRKNLLNKHVSDKEILNAFERCRKVDIKTASFNIIGFPTETIEDIQRTYDFNIEIKADYAFFSLLYPLKGTKLYRKYRREDYIDTSQIVDNYFHGSIIRHPTINRETLPKIRSHLQSNFPQSINLMDAVKYGEL